MYPPPPAPSPAPADPHSVSSLIASLSLAPHPEGGYFRRLHQHASLKLPSIPFPSSSSPSTNVPASSSIHYLLTPSSPIGHFHSNQHLTYHFLHRGRGRYILIHPDTGKVETFLVGHGEGERLMWVVEGGVWKASCLEGGGDGEEVLLISEVVVPSWTPEQHRFLDEEGLRGIVKDEAVRESLRGYLKKE